MLMNENSELRSFVSCSKNFSKNIINKSIKNNIVLINNDGGVKTKRKHRGFIPSTFGVTLTYIKFSIYSFPHRHLHPYIHCLPYPHLHLLFHSRLYSLLYSDTPFSLSSSITALAAPLLLSSFVLSITVLLKSPAASL